MRDRTRSINRLRSLLGTYFPALERALDISNTKAALILLTGYRTPDGLRRVGQVRLESWLRKPKTYNAAKVAATALHAANAQHVRVPGQDVAAATVGRLAKQILALDAELTELDTSIEDRFRRHRHAAVIESMPGIGPLLGAEFLAAVGGDLAVFATADRLAAVAGLAPVPRDSGRISGNHRRPRRYDRRLLRVFYLSAQLSIRSSPTPRSTTTANAVRANIIPRPCWRWSDCGQCCAITPSISRDWQSLRRRESRSFGMPCVSG